jgi:hypothetical protein
MIRLCEAISQISGPSFSVEAHDGRGVAVLRDGGRGGVVVRRAAPWVPSISSDRDAVRTVQGVVEAIHTALTDWPGSTVVGEREPIVTADGDTVTIVFYAANGERLPPIDVVV